MSALDSYHAHRQQAELEQAQREARQHSYDADEAQRAVSELHGVINDLHSQLEANATALDEANETIAALETELTALRAMKEAARRLRSTEKTAAELINRNGPGTQEAYDEFCHCLSQDQHLLDDALAALEGRK
jgi:chromosome segregation ATPase